MVAASTLPMLAFCQQVLPSLQAHPLAGPAAAPDKFQVGLRGGMGFLREGGGGLGLLGSVESRLQGQGNRGMPWVGLSEGYPYCWLRGSGAEQRRQSSASGGGQVSAEKTSHAPSLPPSQCWAHLPA